MTDFEIIKNYITSHVIVDFDDELDSIEQDVILASIIRKYKDCSWLKAMCNQMMSETDYNTLEQVLSKTPNLKEHK